MSRPRPSAPDDRPRWGLILLLGLTSGLSAFGMASIVPALPKLARALSADYGAVQWVISAYLLGLGLFQPLQGLLADRFGRRPVLLGGFALFAAASVLAALAGSLGALVLARFLQAMGVSVATVVTRAIVNDSFGSEAAAVALSFITAVMGVAPILAPFVGGIAADHIGWRGIFWVHAGIAVLLLALLTARLRESRPEGSGGMTFGDLLRGARLLLADRGFLGHTGVYSALSAAGFVFITIGAALFERLFGMSGADFGLMWSGLAFAYVTGATSAGALARRLGAPRTRRLGMLCAVAAAAAFTVAAFLAEPRMALFDASLALLMFANGLVSPLALAAAVRRRPDLAGAGSGLSSSLAMLASMVSAILTGALYDGTARACALLMTAVCVLGWSALRMAENAEAQAEV